MPIYDEKPVPVYELLEDYTTLAAVVSEIEERETPFKDDDGNPQKEVAFTFRPVDPNLSDRKFFGSTPTFWNTSDKCKLRQWAQSMANRAYAPGEPLNTDDLLHRPCRVVLTVKKKKATGELYNWVIDVLPTKSESAAREVRSEVFSHSATAPSPSPYVQTTAYGDEPF